MLASHPASAHVGVRIAVLPVGSINGESFAERLLTIIAAEGLEVSCSNVSTVDPKLFPKLNIVQSAIRYDVGIERPSLLVDATDAEVFYPNRSMIRGFVGVVDASVHDDNGELLQYITDFVADVHRMQRQYGPPIATAPVFRVFVFGARDTHMDIAGTTGSYLRFVPADEELRALSALMTEFTEGIVDSLKTELHVITEADTNGTITLAPDALGISALLPPQYMGHYYGGLQLALLFGVSSFSVMSGGIKKRLQGRIWKHKASLALMAGSSGDALDYLDRAIKALKASNDALFLGLCFDVCATATIHTHALSDNARVADVPYLPDVAGMLRDAVQHFDTVAATVELGALLDVCVQLSVVARLRLARYLLSRPPDTAISAVSSALQQPAARMVEEWRSLLPGKPTSHGPRALCSHYAEDRAACTAERSIASRSFSAYHSTSASAADSVMGGVTNILRTVSVATPGTPSAPAALTFDIVDLLASASARCRDVGNPQAVVRYLLHCADLFDLCGFPRKADACISRACRTLRGLQRLPSMESFIVSPIKKTSTSTSSGSSITPLPFVPAGCVYTALQLPEHSPARSQWCARALGLSTVPWPLPWFENPDLCPHTSSYTFTPSLCAALLSMAMAAREPACAALFCNDASLLQAAAEGKPTHKILSGAAAMLDWLPAVIADCWQCGELPLATNLASLCAAVDRDATTNIALPVTSAALRSADVITAPEEDSSASSKHLDDAGLRRCTVEFADSAAFALLRNRRFMCLRTAASVASQSPLPVIRAFLHRSVITHAMSPVDALTCLDLLRGSAHESRAAFAHSHSSESHDAPGDEMCDEHHGMVDVLLADPCCSVRCSNPKGLRVAQIGGIDKAAMPLQYADKSMTSIFWTSVSMMHQMNMYGLLSSSGLPCSAPESIRSFLPFEGRKTFKALYAPQIPVFSSFTFENAFNAPGISSNQVILKVLEPGKASTVLSASEIAKGAIEGSTLVYAALMDKPKESKTRIYNTDGSGVEDKTHQMYYAKVGVVQGVPLNVHVALRNPSSVGISGEISVGYEVKNGESVNFFESSRVAFDVAGTSRSTVVVPLPQAKIGTSVRITACMMLTGALIQKWAVKHDLPGEMMFWHAELIDVTPPSAAAVTSTSVICRKQRTFDIPIAIYGTAWSYLPQ